MIALAIYLIIGSVISWFACPLLVAQNDGQEFNPVLMVVALVFTACIWPLPVIAAMRK